MCNARYRLVRLLTMAFLVLVVTIGMIVCEVNGYATPPALVAVGSALAGALVALASDPGSPPK